MARAKGTVKKAFYEVSVPLTSSKIVVYGESPESFNGKVITLDLTRSLKGKSLELKCRLKTEGGKILGDPTGIELVGSYIRRMMRKSSDYVEDSFGVECKDMKAIVKPFMITRNRVSRAVRNTLRNEARKYIESHFKSRSARELFSEITANKVQREMSLKLKKVYPLALCEIRAFKLLTGQSAVAKEDRVEEKPAEEGK